ncbi:hypothetical protein M8R20_45130 [Pseudomonas sp. R2.Fl]|nr:hypothetical protein [Pseudomonas sp. R2.Fl]
MLAFVGANQASEFEGKIMATIDSLAREYVQYIRLNQDNPSAVSEIAKRINGITYTDSGASLTTADRARLVGAMEQEINADKRTSDGLYIVVESEDSSQLIRLIQMLKKQVVGD